MLRQCGKRCGRQALARSGRPPWLTDQRTFPLPLLVGAIADTHITDGGWRRLPPEVVEVFARFRVDLVLHAGDVCVPSVLQELSYIAPVIAVTGNNESCRTVELIEAGPYRIAMLHGHGGRAARDEARRWAGTAELVVFGHSHVPTIERVDGTILFNPGSPTDRRWQEHFGLGLIRIGDDGIAPELVLFQDPRHLRNVRPR
ncbi:MAG: hypothetical protein C4345_04775 [Chloroflexota bacterium]